MDDAKSSSPIDGHYHYGEKSKRECAICRLEAERNRLRTVVAHAIETLSESAPDAPGVLVTVDLMRLALDPTGEVT